MSYVVEVVVYCDACGSGLRWTAENEGGLNKTIAGHYATSKGWDIGNGGRDPKRALCPEHARPADRPHQPSIRFTGSYVARTEEHGGLTSSWSESVTACRICGQRIWRDHETGRYRHDARRFAEEGWDG